MIDNKKLSRTLMHVIRLLVNKDFDELAKLTGYKRAAAENLRRVVEEYPRRLGMPPNDNPETLVWDWDEVKGTSSTVHTLDVYLWEDDGTRSELTLSLTLKESSGEMYNVELDDLLVR